MSELAFHALPQPEDFERALSRTDQLFRSHGGAHVVAQGEASFSNVDEQAMQQDMALARYSTFLIPYEADKNEPGSYAPAHAFSRGFMLARPMNDILYDGDYEFADYYSSLNEWMLAQGTENIADERSWFEANSLLVQKYGEGGLERIGGPGQKIVEAWGDSLYVDPSLSRIFNLGCGALAMSGIIHQRSVNERIILSSDFQSSFDDDLSSLIAGRKEGSNE